MASDSLHPTTHKEGRIQPPPPTHTNTAVSGIVPNLKLNFFHNRAVSLIFCFAAVCRPSTYAMWWTPLDFTTGDPTGVS